MRSLFPISKAGLNLQTTKLLSSPEEMVAWGRELGKALPLGSIVCLHGDLGAGKTTLVKGIVEGAAGIDAHHVNSPTFVYLNIYEGVKTVYHFDLYRLHDEEEFLGMGFEEALFGEGIACIEWPSRIEKLIPQEALHIWLRHLEEGKREASL